MRWYEWLFFAVIWSIGIAFFIARVVMVKRRNRDIRRFNSALALRRSNPPTRSEVDEFCRRVRGPKSGGD